MTNIWHDPASYWVIDMETMIARSSIFSNIHYKVTIVGNELHFDSVSIKETLMPIEHTRFMKAYSDYIFEQIILKEVDHDSKKI